MFCTKCGKALTDGDRFCAACGTAVATVASASAETRVLPPRSPAQPESASPPRASPPPPVASPATATAAVPGDRPGGVSLLAFWQFANAALLAISIFGFVSFLFMKPGVPVTLAMVAVFGGLALVVFAAVASGVGLMAMRPYGRALLLPFAWFALILFPIGTVIGFFALRYVYKPEIRAAFAARRAAWPAWVTGGFALLVLGAAVMAGMTARQPMPATGDLATRSGALEIGILADTGDRLLPGTDNLVASDVENAALVSESGMYLVNLRFTPEGAAKMERLTGANLGRQMGFLVNGRIDVVNAATIRTPISSAATLVFADPQEASRFVSTMHALR